MSKFVKNSNFGNSLVCKNKNCPLLKIKKPLNYKKERVILWSLNQVIPFSVYSYYNNVDLSLFNTEIFDRSVQDLDFFISCVLNSINHTLSPIVLLKVKDFFVRFNHFSKEHSLFNHMVETGIKGYKSIFLCFVAKVKGEASMRGLLATYENFLTQLSVFDLHLRKSYLLTNFPKLRHETQCKLELSALDISKQGFSHLLELVQIHKVHIEENLCFIRNKLK